ncbi:MAG TPA: DUF4363 family protein [Bacillota bacterium]|nr:DUF4363 family protein [Clostridiales bacterium]HPU17229.1 DUF4363 family protein [Bacillota bacterium]
MKSLIVAIIIFAITMTVIITASAAAQNASRELMKGVNSVEDATTTAARKEAALELQAMWKERRDIIALTVNNLEIETVEMCLIELIATSSDEEEAVRTEYLCHQLRELFLHIIELDKVTFRNII